MSTPESDTAPAADPALKHIFDVARLQHIAQGVTAVYPAFDETRFLARCALGYDELSLLARLRRVTEALHQGLPADYRQALAVLRELAPRLNHRFVTLILPEYVALYGVEDVEASMEALKFFTPLGSAEFAVRGFLQRDLHGTLAVMTHWSLDPDEHVRRLASEGCRPRLPWSFRLLALVDDPSPVRPILDNLKADPSLYVRKSVANHLNDITKDHPAWAMDLMSTWPADDARTTWIIKHALRSLIKKGDPRALALVGASGEAQVQVHGFSASPQTLTLGQRLTLSFELESTATRSQRLVVDYAVHYVKKSGATSAKVFKLKDVTLPAGARLAVSRQQIIRDFSTRVHYAGRHEIDLLVNGVVLARGFFDLSS